MRKAFFIVPLLFVVALSGCTQPEPETIHKYVCSDGQVVDSSALCPSQEDTDKAEYCADFCEEIEGQIVSDEEFIKSEMEKANYCEVKEDCVLANRKCPLGCYNLVNKDELDRINQLVDSYKQRCVLTCASLKDFNCSAGTCVPILFGT